jgi:hypothetical protein
VAEDRQSPSRTGSLEEKDAPAVDDEESLLVLATVTALVAGSGAPAGARYPYPEPGGGQDPYAYEDYMASAEWPPRRFSTALRSSAT